MSTAPAVPTPVQLNFPACLEGEDPRILRAAWDATNAILGTLPKSDFSPLAIRSPGLKDYGWDHYIRLSVIRMLLVGNGLKQAGLTSGRVLDFGSYFGNFSLFVRNLGIDVDALDTYADYGGAFEHSLNLMRSAGINLIDSSGTDNRLATIPDNTYDALLCLGVIEHVAHTPRPLLQELNRVLKPGGTLLLDTPNLLYIYTREKLMAGRSIFPPIEHQFPVEMPFEGHHREYTPDEVRWMLEQIGHEVNDLQTYNYSLYWLAELTGPDAERWRKMEADASLKEVIFARSSKPL
jgi:2-polyprenyl-3-methyl-5-hydroxy-6-metoxy-1,4-benzoquinol methylase